MEVEARMVTVFDTSKKRGVPFPSIRMATILLFVLTCASAQTSLTVVSATDYVGYPLAPGSIVSMFAPNIATGTFFANDPPPAPLPLSLGGVSATATELGITLPFALIAVTPSQVNAIMPYANISGQPVLVTLTTSSGAKVTATISTYWTAPSLFTADESGAGVPAAQVVIGHADGSQTFIGSVAQCSSSGCTPLPINLGSSTDEAVLELFGTGIRGVAEICGLGPCQSSPASPPVPAVTVMATSNTYPYAVLYSSLPVLYYGPQGGWTVTGDPAPGSFYGLDQVNVLLPHSMAGLGPIELTLIEVADPTWQNKSVASNSVTVDIQ
jgi:uncharacterized protein (TIGR03437 family)